LQLEGETNHEARRSTTRAVSAYAIYLLLGFVVLVRLGYALALPDALDPLWRDGVSYDNIARNLLSGVGYWDTVGEWPDEPPFADPSAPTARWMPGYPLFVAGVYWLTGSSYRAIYLSQALMGLGIAGLIYLLGRDALGRQAGLLAVAVYAVDPFSIYLVGRFQTEQLFTLFVVATLYCFCRMTRAKPDAVGWAVLFGVTAGAAALTRNVAGLVFGGLCLIALFGVAKGLERVPLRRRVVLLSAASVVFLAAVAPWVIRNQRVTGRFVMSTQSWQALAMTNNDAGGPYFTVEGYAAMPQTTIQQSEMEREEIYRRFVMDWISRNPGHFALLCLQRILVFWWPAVNTVSGAQALIGLAFNAALFSFAALSIFTLRRYWREMLPIHIALLIFTLGYATVAAITRYRLPVYPLLTIMAAGGMLSILRGRHSDAVVQQRRP
jgi:4-amino-4-deoxy-L-arabinose transferase-like glycosyltransferase